MSTEIVKTRFTSSIGWSILTNWSSKLLGMINTIVLARLLSPDDFGIVAMATIVITMIDSMTQIGVHFYVIRQKNDNQKVFNTAWTINLIQAAIIALVLAIIAPWIALFFDEQAVTNIIYCLAIIKVIKGFESFGTFIAQKHLQFTIDFKLTLYSRIFYIISTVGFALWLENYWAIVYGQLTAIIVRLILSYAFHPFRPKIQFYQWRKMLTYSKSTIPLCFGSFINNQLDITVIGKVAPTEYLGQYHVAANLASMFTKELMMPFIKGLVPNLSKIKDTPDFHYIFRLIITGAVYMFLPLGIGLSLVSEEFVFILLGEKWVDTAPVLAWLSLYAMLSGLMLFISEEFLLVFELEKLSNRLMWQRNIILIIIIAFVLIFFDYTIIPIAMVVAALIAFPLTIYEVASALNLKKCYLMAHWWPALLGTGMMVIAIQGINWPDVSEWLLLIFKISLGASVYISVIVSLYWLRGKPEETPERLLLNKIIKT